MAYLKARKSADEVSSSEIPSDVSYIQPGVLYPAVEGKLSDGSTVHSGAYGTAQSDNFSYYYTDIKGSKPIKDPRIGAHFGTQRHKTKSYQLLEQETATHGSKVWSMDGREWFRMCQGPEPGTGLLKGSILAMNRMDGHSIGPATSLDAFYEIVGYFNDLNVLCNGYVSGRGWTTKVDGGAVSSADHQFETTNKDPKGNDSGGRFVDGGYLGRLQLGLTLGIHTVRISPHTTTDYVLTYAIELTAQDTTSTATKSQIQIPSQNVISFGKKFTVAGTPHYNPFATKGDDSASTIPNNTTGDSVATGWSGSTSAYWEPTLDTATSLGLGAWESGGAYYRPVNGGRIVKWVDSTGTIKTSVNMMPPEADSIAEDAGTCDATGTHNWSTKYQPSFGNKRIGSDKVSNGTFDSDVSGWSGYQTSRDNVTGGQSGNRMRITQNIANTYGSAFQQITGLTIGRLYKLSFYADRGTAPSINVGLGVLYYGLPSYFAINCTHTDNTTLHTYVWRATVTSAYLVAHPATATVGHVVYIDTVSFYEIEEPTSQAEVAKVFHHREFGNGAANSLGGGPGSSTYADASMLHTIADNISYTMDDGLTSLYGESTKIGWDTDTTAADLFRGSTTAMATLTFIGTGIERFGNIDTTSKVAQNLPYGTHVFKQVMNSNNTDTKYYMDGVELITRAQTAFFNQVSIHQPKMPPIPENAVVIADYMLMADFVPQTAAGLDKISKGVRSCSVSRDVLYEAPSADKQILTPVVGHYGGWKVTLTSDASDNTSVTQRCPSFCTNWVVRGENVTQYGLYNETTASAGDTGSGSGGGNYKHLTTSITLGNHNPGWNVLAWQSPSVNAIEFASPIHTSSHYQTFETPLLNELVGGDRNMEQTNLVVTPEGKTWDEVTRDTRYMGNRALQAGCDLIMSSTGSPIIFDDWRGHSATYPADDHQAFFNKDFAIGYDRHVCIRSGTYMIHAYSINSGSGVTAATASISINGVAQVDGHTGTSGYTQSYVTFCAFLERGDYVQIINHWHSNHLHNGYWIERT